MKIVWRLTELPELQGLSSGEKRDVLLRWRREFDRTFGYWRHIKYSLLIALPIMLLPPIIFAKITSLRPAQSFAWVCWGIGFWTAQIFFSNVAMPKRRDILERILQERSWQSKRSMNLSPEETARNRAEVFIGLSVLVGGFGTLCILLGAAQAYRGKPYVVWAVLGLASLLLCVYLAIAARSGKR